jgi:hypothetical protein
MNDYVALEKHYRVKELATRWALSANTVIRLFANEPGVVRIESDSCKRKYTVISIPESVALCVHERLSHKSLQPCLASGHPLRVIKFGDLNARMPKQPRNIPKLKAA